MFRIPSIPDPQHCFVRRRIIYQNVSFLKRVLFFPLQLILLVMLCNLKGYIIHCMLSNQNIKIMYSYIGLPHATWNFKRNNKFITKFAFCCFKFHIMVGIAVRFLLDCQSVSNFFQINHTIRFKS